jgi:hypothetical protein
MKIHSVIDVITNSSSELFICNTDKTIEMVREIMDELVEVYKKATGDQRDVSEMLFVTDCNDPIIKDHMRQWRDYYPDMNSRNGKKIAIKSVYDNTMPVCLFEFIEEVFNAKRYHLG